MCEVKRKVEVVVVLVVFVFILMDVVFFGWKLLVLNGKVKKIKELLKVKIGKKILFLVKKEGLSIKKWKIVK